MMKNNDFSAGLCNCVVEKIHAHRLLGMVLTNLLDHQIEHINAISTDHNDGILITFIKEVNDKFERFTININGADDGRPFAKLFGNLMEEIDDFLEPKNTRSSDGFDDFADFLQKQMNSKRVDKLNEPEPCKCDTDESCSKKCDRIEDKTETKVETKTDNSETLKELKPQDLKGEKSDEKSDEKVIEKSSEKSTEFIPKPVRLTSKMKGNLLDLSQSTKNNWNIFAKYYKENVPLQYTYSHTDIVIKDKSEFAKVVFIKESGKIQLTITIRKTGYGINFVNEKTNELDSKNGVKFDEVRVQIGNFLRA